MEKFPYRYRSMSTGQLEKYRKEIQTDISFNDKMAKQCKEGPAHSHYLKCKKDGEDELDRIDSELALRKAC